MVRRCRRLLAGTLLWAATVVLVGPSGDGALAQTNINPPDVLSSEMGKSEAEITHVPAASGQLRIIAPYAAEGQETDTFLRGLELAINEINAGGGILGRPVLLQPVIEATPSDFESTSEEVDRALRLADKIVTESDLLAIVGHSTSTTAVPSSTVYQRRGKLFLATHTTHGSLSNLGFDRVFMLTPNNGDLAAAMAWYAHDQGYRRFVVVSDRSEFGRDISIQFREFVTTNEGEILHQSLLDGDARSTSRLLLFILDNALFKLADVDAIFLAAVSSRALIDFITKARNLNIKQPILGPQNLFSAAIEEAVGDENMTDVTAVSIYDAQSSTSEARDFLDRFSRAYQIVPDQRAAIGYDAVKLLQRTAEETNSLDSQTLTDALLTMRYKTPFVGATGPISFDKQGRVVDTQIFINRHDGTQFDTVADFTLPFNHDWAESHSHQGR